MSKLINHSYILATIFFTVYSQLIIRWQVGATGQLPIDMPGKIRFVIDLLINPWVLTGIAATFLAGVSWMLTMAKFEISYAFPFMGVNYILILASGILLFNESFTLSKFVGTLLVLAGVIVIALGSEVR